MSKNNKLLLSIIGGFLFFCCGLPGLASLLPSSDAATPTAVALVVEVEQSQSPAEEQAGEPGASALQAQPSAAPATVDIEPTDVPTLQPTAPPEPTATATNTPQPTNTAAPTATNTSAPSPTATVANTPTPGITDPLGNPIVGDLARVTQIVDGDTIDVDINGQVYRVRYIGMNTPERGRPFFQEATDANANLVSGQTVILVKDVSETDRFGRLLRYVYLQDGTFVNAELVRLGYAMASAYPPDVAMQHIFTEVQRTAVESGAGLWSSQAAATAVPTIRATSPPQPTSPPAPQPTTPPQPQPTAPPAPSGGVTIVGVNKRDEYVDIRNQSGSDVDLAGWVLVSEKGNQRCNLGGVITVGQTLRIWALASDAGQGGYNCGFGSPIWNNSESDPAVLYNAAGQEVSRW